MKKSEKTNKFTRIYLIYAVVIGILGILFLFRPMILSLQGTLLYSVLASLILVGHVLAVGFTVISFYALFKFLKEKINKIFLIIPIIEIIEFLIGAVLGIIIIVNQFQDKTVSFRTLPYDITVSVFFIIFASYLLYRFKKQEP